jgi:SAM-dependent methyltransferase
MLMTPDTAGFQDHFSAVATDYALARPGYPSALFDWIASIVPGRERAWEAGCGSGQATRGLAARFGTVYATDPSSAQIAQAPELANVAYSAEPAEHCRLADASVDAVCVGQALHWFDRDAFFAECARVLRPGGVLVAWGYQDLVPPAPLVEAVASFAAEIAGDWPRERALVDAAYAGFDWPFEAIAAPAFDMVVNWPLARLLGYFGSYSATKRCRERTGDDPVARHAGALAAAWGDPAVARRLHWPLFVHARRKPGG